MPHPGPIAFQVSETQTGTRLDLLVSRSFPDCSRAGAARLIRGGCIRVDGRVHKPGYTVRTGEWIRGEIPAPAPICFLPEPLPITVLYEDDHLLVVNKAPGQVVHPAPGHASGTLVNALLHRCGRLAGVGEAARPGIVHRLDKDTSGALVVAKTPAAFEDLARQFKTRRVRKCYLAVIRGRPKQDSGGIEKPIGRHPTNRKRMSIHSRRGRVAVTRWRLRERFEDVSLLEVEILTGRTHQIRVHLSSENMPVVGDPVYGRRGAARVALRLPASVGRQMLHAWRLGFNHPHDGRFLSLEAPPAADMQLLLNRLREKGDQTMPLKE